MKKKVIFKLINYCYCVVGLKDIVIFVDQLMYIGFVYLIIFGVFIGVNDFVILDEKVWIINVVIDEVKEIESQYVFGLVIQGEKYNKVIDLWLKVNDEVFKVMMVNFLKEKVVDCEGKEVDQEFFNFMYMMVDLGVWGFVVQICQLVGMCGLMVKLDGLIIEILIIVNFCEGLNVFQYFIFIYGVCKGLVDIVLKIVNFGYLICCLVDVVQDLVVIEIDCGIEYGLLMLLYIEGGDVVELFGECVFGCVIVCDVFKLGSDEVIVLVGILIDEKWVDFFEVMSVDEVVVCFLIICEICYGICVMCYGCDLVCGYCVNIGEVVGVIVVQFIGELGIQLIMCIFYIGGVVSWIFVVDNVQVKNGGIICLYNLKYVVCVDGVLVVVFCFGELVVVDDFGCECECYKLLYGVVILVKEGDKVDLGVIVVKWDLYIYLIVIEVDGIVVFVGMEEGIIVKCQIDELIGLINIEVMDLKDCLVVGKDICLVVKLIDVVGKDLLLLGIDVLVQYFLLVNVLVNLIDGVKVSIGDVVVCILQEILKICDIIGGLLCVVDLFEVCCLKEFLILVEISGIIFFGKEIKGKCCLVIMLNDGSDLYEELILKWCYLNVFEGEQVNCGEVIFDGLSNLYDILCLLGVSLLVKYIVNEIQDVYCLQGVKINDKYIEIILCQMLCKVEVSEFGDFSFIKGDQVEFIQVLEENEQFGIEDKFLVKYEWVLLGIIKVFLLIELFIFVVLFQEIICVFIEVVVIGKCDFLCGLKENVVVGCLILVGIGLVYYSECKCQCDFGKLQCVSVSEVEVVLIEVLNLSGN